MSVRNLDRLFSPRSVAVIGATPREGALGQIVLERLLGAGFGGPVIPVNPKHRRVGGLDAVASVRDLAVPPDLAVVVTPARTVPGIVEELGRAGSPAAVVISAGIDEESGLKARMLEVARRYGVRILGPNCIGLIRPPIALNASFAHLMPAPGRLAFVSQSGAIIGAVIDWASGRGIGFSHIVSLGDMADVSVADVLDHLATDGESRAILLYLEGITDAKGFMSAARAAARVKPVIALKSGRHAVGAKAASSHTGAMAGSDALFDAALVRAGVLRIRTLEDLFDAAEVLEHAPKLRGERLAIVTNGGGAGVLAADAVADFGGTLATLSAETTAALDEVLPPHWSRANPVDIIGDAGPARYGAAMDAVLADPEVDAVLAMNCPTALASSAGAARAVIGALERHRAAAHRPKPVFANWLGDGAAREARLLLDEAEIAAFDTPADAVRAWSYIVRREQGLARLMRVPPSIPPGQAPDWEAARAAIARALDRGAKLLNEAEAKEVIAAAGIPTVRTLAATSPEEARSAAEQLAAAGVGRFAVKILSDDLSHKSDVGGVILDLADAGAVAKATRRMLAEVADRAPEARITGVSVQEMVRRPDAHELIAGIAEDPQFGPAILFGAGGVSVEVVDDKALGLPPLDMTLAEDLIGQTRISRLLAGYRRRPAADREAIAATLVRLAEVARALPMIRELDINPLLADETGVIAVDARIVVAPDRMDEPAPNRRLAIRPYPVELEGRLRLPDGSEVICRPIRPEDAALYPPAFEKMTPEDLRLRLFAPVAQAPMALVARLTQIDYARAMAFVALDPDDGSLMGVARMTADPDMTNAEYGVLVRSDLKGRGIGWALMTRLIEHARAEGIAELWGDVLPENRGMLKMARELGFRVEPKPDEGLVRVRLDLSRFPA